MNFERGLEVKEAIGIGLKTVELLFVGYNQNQPHNKEVTIQILENPFMEDWATMEPENLKVYTNPDPDDDMNNIVYTFSGKWLKEQTLQDLLDNRRIGFLEYKNKKYPI